MTMNIDWAAILALAATNIGCLVFFLGRVRSQIDALGARIGKLESDTDKEKDATKRVEDSVHRLALDVMRAETILNDIKSRVEGLCLEGDKCPLARGLLVPTTAKRPRKGAHAEGDGAV